MSVRRFLTGLVLIMIACMDSVTATTDPWSLVRQHPEFDQHNLIVVDISSQSLQWLQDGKLQKRYRISSSRYGVGSRAGSNRTPLGLHYVKRKIGADAQAGTIFKGRVSTDRIARIEPRPIATGNDYVTTRILWLGGLEPGRNKGEGVDSFSRYIYIHGTHEEGLIGKPASHGCIRMFSQDVIELFNSVHVKTLVWIQK